MRVPLPLAFFAGTMSFFSPCILPMLGAYVLTMTGLALPDLPASLAGRRIRRRLLSNTAMFVLAFALVFTAVGGLAPFLGEALGRALPHVNVAAGFLVGAFALSLLEVPVLGWPGRWLAARGRSGRMLRTYGPGSTAFVMGLLFAVVCSHCIGAVLYSFLIYVGTTSTPREGMVTMAVFSAGLALPYLLTAVWLGQATRLLDRVRRHQRLISAVTGVLMLVTAVVLVTGRWNWLVGWLARVLPYRLPVGM
ncbi:MAG: cytochrome c biogenesis protein CcdA [Bacillota bacterium]